MRTLCGLIGVALYGVVVYAAFAGTAVPTANLAPTAIYVAFWVGIPVLSVLLGDVFALFSPWRALYRWISGAARRISPSLDAEPMAYPAWLGRWPAALGLVAFAWVELVYVDRDVPATLGVLALAYGFVQVRRHERLRRAHVERARRRVRRLVQPLLAHLRVGDARARAVRAAAAVGPAAAGAAAGDGRGARAC